MLEAITASPLRSITMNENPIGQFFGAFRFLSNFFPAFVFYDGDLYPSVEHAYQAAKTADSHARLFIRSKATASDAKRAGQQVELRNGWDGMKIEVMEALVRDKFQRNPHLALRLLQTGERELIEGNHWGDTFWGTVNGIGENHLGKILMKVRNELQQHKYEDQS